MEYLRSWGRHLGTAIVDVGIVSVITLAPLILARLRPFANPYEPHSGAFWDFLTNGQLAFYSIGSLAAILLAILRQKVPKTLSLLAGLGALLALLFLAWLIGLDPELRNASVTFVGTATLYLYIIVQIVRTIVEAAKQIGAGDALRAGDRATGAVGAGLASRKGVRPDE